MKNRSASIALMDSRPSRKWTDHHDVDYGAFRLGRGMNGAPNEAVRSQEGLQKRTVLVRDGAYEQTSILADPYLAPKKFLPIAVCRQWHLQLCLQCLEVEGLTQESLEEEVRTDDGRCRISGQTKGKPVVAS